MKISFIRKRTNSFPKSSGEEHEIDGKEDFTMNAEVSKKGILYGNAMAKPARLLVGLALGAARRTLASGHAGRHWASVSFS